MPDVLLGTVADADGDVVEVWRNADETVSLISLREDDPALTFTPDGLDEVRELLDRAAMPGQRATIPHVVTNLDAHLRHGCPTCLRAEAERRAEAHGAVT